MGDEQVPTEASQQEQEKMTDTTSQQVQQTTEQPPQSFAPRVGFLQPPRHRFPIQSNSFPPNGVPPGPPGFPHMRPPFRPPPNFQPPPGSHGDAPPPSFFNTPPGMQRMPGLLPNMGGAGGPSPRGPLPMGGGGPRPPFPPGGFHGAPPPGFRLPMGMPPFGCPPCPQGPTGQGGMQPMQNGHPQNNAGQTQQPVNQAERLKKIVGVPAEKELWIETKTGEGKAYFYQSETRQTVWERPDPSKTVVMPQDELQRLVEQAHREEKDHVHQQQGGGHYGGTPGPPFMIPGFPGNVNTSDAWQEFSAPDGRKYYYNFLTRENTWTKPKTLIDKEGVMPIMGTAAMAPIAGVGYAGFRPSVATGGPQATLSPAQVGQKDKSRPVTSNAVAGTPWCVVWTGDNRVFFFNPSTRTSVWERPPELYNRPDVDILVSKPPPAKEQRSNCAQKRLQKEESEEEEVDEEDDVEDQGSDTSNSDDQEKTPSKPVKKKTRKEKKAEEELKAQQEQQKLPKLPLPVQQEKPVDPAIQAELEAQREREKIPLEERIRQFRRLLEDKKVSATSTWEKELSKIVFDQRYLLLSAVERKAAFDAYCRERSEVEKEEKKRRAKEAKDEYMKLLEESKLHGKSTFVSFSAKWAKDIRFKAVEKNRDRESYFKDFVENLYKKEKEEKRRERDKAKEEFVELLRQQTDLRRNSIWAIVKKRLDKDERYRNRILDSDTRQKLFKEHIKTCSEPTEEEEAEAKRLADEALEPIVIVKEQSEDQHNNDRDGDKDRKKSSRKRDKERVVEKTAEEKALEDRKREVEEELGEHLKERNREHERHKLLEHEQNFKALLADLIRNTDAGWHDGRKLLKKDARYQNCDFLDKDAKERHFREHIRDLERKKRDILYQLLDEHQDITFVTKWHLTKKIIADDERFSKLKIDERKIEHEYRDWMERRHRQALDDFEALLRETKIITYKSKQMITENEQHLRDVLAVLENDTRYLVLKDRPNERERILEDYLDSLARKGPPPPPTRNEDPERRRK